MDKNNKNPLSDEQQQVPVGDTQPFGQTPGEDRTIAFEAGSQDTVDAVDDILEEDLAAEYDLDEDTAAGWEEETVAVNVGTPELGDEQQSDEEEEQPEQVAPEQEAMPSFRRNNPLKRVPKRVYHRGRLFSLIYVLVTVTVCVFASVMFLRVFAIITHCA